MSFNEDDKNFWLETVKDITENKPVNVVTIKNNHHVEVKKHEKFAVIQEFTAFSKNSDELKIAGIDKATMRKFKREEFNIDAILDLHGITEDEAYIRVNNFVVQAYNSGKRCIVIITGKGLTVRENYDIFTTRGILKKQVPQWLDMPQIRAMILTYKHPSEKLGGSGALYILLRRNKNI